MSKAEEATNDFCTRCFKYSKYTKVQSECTMADSYQEGYEEGYHQAEEDLIDKTLDFLKDKLYKNGYVGIIDLCDDYIKAMKDE